MSWFHKNEDNDPYKGKLKYYEDLSYTLQTKVDQLEKENKELKKVSTDIL